jgi:hypothetical protein
MLLFGMMCFIEYEQVDLLHSNKRVNQALMKNLACAYDNHFVLEMLIPSPFLQII